MIRFLLFSTILILSVAVTAQTESMSWTDSDNEWKYRLISPSPNQRSVSLLVDRDTTINNIKCAILKNDTLTEYYPEIIVYPEDDDSRLYRFVDTGFAVLYDFNLSAGDTYDVVIPASDFGGEIQGYRTIRVDSTWTEVIGGRTVAAQQLSLTRMGNNDRVPEFYGVAYQYTGLVDIYFIPIPPVLCDAACPFTQFCFRNGDQGEDIQLGDQSCDFISFTEGFNDVSDRTQLYPSLVTSGNKPVLQLSPELVHAPAECRLIDQLGRVIWQRAVPRGQTRVTLDLPNLAGGMYYLTWQTQRARAVHRLIMQR